MDKQIVIYTYNGILSALKRNGVLIYATAGMNPEKDMQSEGSHTQKDTYCMISFT